MLGLIFLGAFKCVQLIVQLYSCTLSKGHHCSFIVDMSILQQARQEAVLLMCFTSVMNATILIIVLSRRCLTSCNFSYAGNDGSLSVRLSKYLTVYYTVRYKRVT